MSNKKLFDFSFLRLARVNDFFGYVNSVFWIWFFMYAGTFIILFGINWLGNYSGLDNKLTNPISNKSVGLWIFLIFLAILAWVIYQTGLRYLLKYFAELFSNLSEYRSIDIILAIFIFAIFPFLPFLFLPVWLAVAFPSAFMLLGPLIQLLERSARKCPSGDDIFKIVDLDSIISNSIISNRDNQPPISEEKLKEMIKEIYSQKTWEKQIITLAWTLIYITECENGGRSY